VDRPKFDRNGLCHFTDYQGKRCYLAQETWRKKTQHQERRHLKYNFEKIRLTVRSPDEVRRSTQRRDCRILYRNFLEWSIGRKLPGHWKAYVAVIIDDKRGRIQTIYTTLRMKKGEKLWPK
jgi:hypothetical protein